MTLLESNDRGVSEKLAIMTFSDKAVIINLNNKGNKMHNLSRSLSLCMQNISLNSVKLAVQRLKKQFQVSNKSMKVCGRRLHSNTLLHKAVTSDSHTLSQEKLQMNQFSECPVAISSCFHERQTNKEHQMRNTNMNNHQKTA